MAAVVVRYELATPEALDRVAGAMREAERELVVGAGQEPAEALRRVADLSVESFVAWVPEGPALAFGVYLPSLAGGEAWLWGAPTPLVDRYRKTFLRENRRILPELSGRWGRLGGWVDGRNQRSCSWLRRLGFDLEPVVGMDSQFRFYART